MASGFHQMGGENLHAYRQEDDAAEELGLETAGDSLAEMNAEQVACQGKKE